MQSFFLLACEKWVRGILTKGGIIAKGNIEKAAKISI